MTEDSSFLKRLLKNDWTKQILGGVIVGVILAIILPQQVGKYIDDTFFPCPEELSSLGRYGLQTGYDESGNLTLVGNPEGITSPVAIQAIRNSRCLLNDLYSAEFYRIDSETDLSFLRRAENLSELKIHFARNLENIDDITHLPIVDLEILAAPQIITIYGLPRTLDRMNLQLHGLVELNSLGHRTLSEFTLSAHEDFTFESDFSIDSQVINIAFNRPTGKYVDVDLSFIASTRPVELSLAGISINNLRNIVDVEVEVLNLHDLPNLLNLAGPNYRNVRLVYITDIPNLTEVTPLLEERLSDHNLSIFFRDTAVPIEDVPCDETMFTSGNGLTRCLIR